VKVDAGAHQIVAWYRDFRRHGKTEKTAASWMFAFTARTLIATHWLVALIGPHLVFT